MPTQGQTRYKALFTIGLGIFLSFVPAGVAVIATHGSYVLAEVLIGIGIMGALVAIYSGNKLWNTEASYNPDVVIEDLGQEVDCSFDQNQLRCLVKGHLVNNSATGTGELKSLKLRVFLDDTKYLDIPSGSGYMGFRFDTHGVFPSVWLDFILRPVQENIIESIAGKSAEIQLQVIGQTIRTYRVTMSS